MHTERITITERITRTGRTGTSRLRATHSGRRPRIGRIGRTPRPGRLVITPALLLAGTFLLGGSPQAGAMGIPATRIDRLFVAYDDGSGHPRTYALTCGHDELAGPAELAGAAGETANGASEEPEDFGGPAERHLAGEDRADRNPCAHLDRIGGPLPAVPDGQACSMIYGGPQTATVTGMWRGHHIHEDYRRTNGCEVARWSRMVPALPAPLQGPPRMEPLRG
ncbi:hypothetical protein [Actinacidiphila acididurans]|uniref:Subtilisin inhibitor domain-containing protein n=1 Tax=Actinacidiphila acididurans TaxID=2784346 RepID=A0ABS2U075_9ACTN|nr:hypothetical protein [Actinacidiphila acididurans]MBM9508997.1 hypothetical protein [Actinacidiphila acididurans]